MIRPFLLGLAAVLPLAAGEPVTVFMYSEYIHPKIAEEFTAATGHPCTIQVYEAQEDMMAKLTTGGSGQYDVVVATDTIIPQMIALDLVQPLDRARLPTIGNLDPAFMDRPFDRGNRYSVPYFWGTVGLLYDGTKVTGEATWAWFLDPARQPGPFVIMDEARTTIGCMNLALGRDINARTPADLKAVADALIAAKRSDRCLGFDGGVGAKNRVAKGEALVGMVYNGDAVTAIKENPALRFAIPREGSNIWMDNLLVTKGSRNVAGAHAFINYITGATVAAQNANHMHYATANAAARPMLEPEDVKNPAIYPPPEVMARLHYLGDPGKDLKLLEAAWTRIKAK